jgi:hypothetical protein
MVECLKEFQSILWDQKLKVYTDHKKLVRDALEFMYDHVYRRRLILEGQGPETVHTRGTHNIVADAISRLDYDEDFKTRSINVHLSMKALAKLFTCHFRKTSGSKEFQTNDPHVLRGVHSVADLLELPRINYSCIRAIASKVLSLLFCML